MLVESLNLCLSLHQQCKKGGKIQTNITFLSINKFKQVICRNDFVYKFVFIGIPYLDLHMNFIMQ